MSQFRFVPIHSSIAEQVRRTGRWRAEVDPAISRLLAIPAVEYLHVRNREYGCYIARVERVPAQEGG